jgi:3-hydroxybutyryl-CoA dehydratase
MSEPIYAPRGMHFEEFELGQSIVTAGRTVTEADIVHFAGLSGDYNQIHTDAAFAAADTFGLHAKFSRPVFIGDTIRVKIEIADKRALPRMGGGNVNMKVRVVNQEDKVVQRGDWIMLVKSKA